MSNKALFATIGVLAALGASVGAGTRDTEFGSGRAGAFDAGGDSERARTGTSGPRDRIVPEHVRRSSFSGRSTYVPGMVLQTAPPNDFDEFLRRVDLWNFFGAPCP